MLFVISGPSGVGKGTLIQEVLAKHKDISLAVSATTRLPREGERDKESYYFLSKTAFQAAIEANAFLEWCLVHQHHYGTLKSEISTKLNQYRAILIEIDVQGAKKIKTHSEYPQCHIFIAPPSIDALEERLRTRNTETEEAILKRLKIAKDECSQSYAYDLVIVNNELTQSVIELNNVILRILTKGVTP